MILLGKIALGIGGSLVLAGAYTFRQGVIRFDVDEFHSGGSHVHFWVPAAAVPMTFRIMPKEYLSDAAEEIKPWMPTIRAVTKELKKFPDIDLVEVRDEKSHVQVRTRGGKLLIDVEDPGERIHIVCPIETVEDATRELVAHSPSA